MVVAGIDGPHHLWVTSPLDQNPMAVILPRDEFFVTRCNAGMRFDRWLSGLPPARSHPPWAPTLFQRRRLDRLLAVLDARQSGTAPTSYDVAIKVLFPRLALARGNAWKASNERRQTLRALEQARLLVDGGYRDLLKGIVRG